MYTLVSCSLTAYLFPISLSLYFDVLALASKMNEMKKENKIKNGLNRLADYILRSVIDSY